MVVDGDHAIGLGVVLTVYLLIGHEPRVVVPRLAHPVLLHVFFRPIVTIVAYVVFRSGPHQEIVDVTLTRIPGAGRVRGQLLLKAHGGLNVRLLAELHLTADVVLEHLSRLVGILAAVIDKRRRSSHAAVLALLGYTHGVV